MKSLELWNKMIKSMEGLEVNFKVGNGKDSELVLKGDFMQMMNVLGTVLDAQAKNDNAKRKINDFENDILL